MTALESTVLELLRQKLWHDRSGSADTGLGDSSSVSWLAPSLLQLLADSHDQPATQLAPVVRQMLIEHQHVNDSVDAEHRSSERDVDEDVDVIVEVLEKVRQEGIKQGHWSDMPITPQYYG